MRIAFDAQILYDSMKTGIGKTAEYILTNMPLEAEHEYYLNIRDTRKHNLRNEIVDILVKRGFKIQLAPWYYSSIQWRTEKWFDIPYFMLYPKKMDVTIFFNYLISTGVRGKKVTFVHDMTYKAFPETMEEKNRENLERHMDDVVKRADCILTDSLFSKKEIIKYFPIAKPKVHVISLGVDTNKFCPNNDIQKIKLITQKYNVTGKYLLYLGTLEPRKNIINIVKAYESLRKDLEEIPTLVIAGKKGWMYDEIFAAVQKGNLMDKVIFTGYVDEEDIPFLMSGAECFVFPSIYEGFGLPPLEAMACGVPVISSECASLPEVIGDAGILVDPYSIDEIKKAMFNLLTDISSKQTYVSAGIEQSRKFTWFKTGIQLNRILNML